MREIEGKKYYTMQDVADAAGVCNNTVWKMVRYRQIVEPSFRINPNSGKFRYFTEAEYIEAVKTVRELYAGRIEELKMRLRKLTKAAK